MPKLTDDQLRDIVHGALQASLVGNQDGIFDALQPLEDGGDYGDAYLLTVALINVIKLALPPQVCPTHGPGSDCAVTGVGIVGIDRETGEQVALGENGDMVGSVTPEIAAEYPDVIGFMRMLAAELNNDEDTSIALWHVAVENDYADQILFRAIDSATEVVRAGRAALQ